MFTEMRRRVKRVVYTLQMLSAGNLLRRISEPRASAQREKGYSPETFPKRAEHLVPKIRVTIDTSMIH